jgi:hypothetical protein
MKQRALLPNESVLRPGATRDYVHGRSCPALVAACGAQYLCRVIPQYDGRDLRRYDPGSLAARDFSAVVRVREKAGRLEAAELPGSPVVARDRVEDFGNPGVAQAMGPGSDVDGGTPLPHDLPHASACPRPEVDQHACTVEGAKQRTQRAGVHAHLGEDGPARCRRDRHPFRVFRRNSSISQQMPAPVTKRQDSLPRRQPYLPPSMNPFCPDPCRAYHSFSASSRPRY